MTANIYKPQPIRLALLRTLAKSPAPASPREIRDKQTGMILRHQPSGYLAVYVEVSRGKRERLCDARQILDDADPYTLGEAREEAKRLRGLVAGGTDFTAQRAEQRGIPTLDDYLDKTYGPWVVEDKVSGAQTLERIKTHFSGMFGKKRLDEFTIADLDRWTTKRRKSGVRAETINRDLFALRGALSRAVKLKIIRAHPMQGHEPLQTDPHRRVVRALTPDELDRLRAALSARDDEKRAGRANANQWRAKRGYPELPVIGTYADALSPAVLLSVETGMRRGELFALDWQDADWEERVLRVRGETTKSYASREVPLNAAAREVLRNWWLQQGQPEQGYVLSTDGGMLGSLKKSYAKVLKGAGIESKPNSRINWHSLRHTFGTRLGAKGVDAATIKDLMGHADLQTTQRYLHSDADRKRLAVEDVA